MISICTPSRDLVHIRFANDLVQVIMKGGVDFIPSEGTVIPNQRDILVEEALKRGSSHILFIDSDMRFPPDIVQRMESHKQPIVAANCVDKRSGRETIIKENGKIISVGCAIMMVDRKVFEKIEKPWFFMPWDGEKLVGEDRWFCHKAIEAGFNITIDNKLSKEIKHIGLKEYGIE